MNIALKTATVFLSFVFTAPLFADNSVINKYGVKITLSPSSFNFKKIVWVELPPEILNNDLLYITTIRDRNTKNYVLHTCVSRHNAIRIKTIPGPGKDIKLPIGEYEYIIEVTPLTQLDIMAVIKCRAGLRPGMPSREIKYPLMERNIIYKTGYLSFAVEESPISLKYGSQSVYAIISFFRRNPENGQ